MLSFIPLNDDGKEPDNLEGTGEFLFILDRSGSMSGNRIELAKKAAVLFLKSLPFDSKFNIISFGSDALKLYPESILAYSKNVNSAIEKISSMNANMGGTNIYKTLSLIFSDPVDDKYPRSLFLITDGGEGDSMHSINLIKNNATKCRIHGFGIQTSGREAHFIQDAANLGKGFASFINNIDELGGKIVSSLSKCILPCMNTWEINWAGQAVPQTQNLGSIYYGERFIQYILMDNIPENILTVEYYDTYKKHYQEVAVTNQKLINGDEIFKFKW